MQEGGMDGSKKCESSLGDFLSEMSAAEGRKVVYYRILSAPPGYPPHQRYIVAAYQNLAYDSCLGRLTNEEGSQFVETLEEARRMIPEQARRLPFEPEYQFLELWESTVAAASTSGRL
jgi:hypothetical protein